MAPSPLRSISRKHARSISLPSRTHPFMPQFDEQLGRLRASEAIPSSLLSMIKRLGDLKDLYGSNDDVLQLPHIQQTISQECQEKWADELLDGYLRLLDACSVTRDLFSHTKQSMQELLSALRRKDTDDVSSYLNSRKNSKKTIQKTLKDLKSIRNRQCVLASVKDCKIMEVLTMLREAESITLTMFESFLFYVNGTKVHSKQSGWFTISKLITPRVPNQAAELNANEFEKVDTALTSFISHKRSENDGIQVEAIQSQLEDIQSSIHILEEELECILRRLIKSRVSLLNILNH